jgi:hypothetical protein
MPTTASETLYDLALRALGEQEREVDSLRTRTGTIVAAAAVAATLLGREVFAGSRPDGFVAWTGTGIGLAGLAVVLLASVYLLRSHDLAFSMDAAATFEEALDGGALEDETPDGLHIGLTYGLSSIQAHNAPTVQRLKSAFALALGALVLVILGLGVGAALA